MDKLLHWYGEARYRELLERVRRFWAGEGRYIVSITSSHAYYRQAFDDARILDSAPHNLEHQAQLPGLNLPSFYPDFGTVSTAKFWGGTARFDSTGGNIFIDPMAQTVQEALALQPRPVDDPEQDGAHAVRLYHALCDRLETDNLWLRSADFQGTLSTAGLVTNQEEMLMTMYEDPEALHALLDRVCTLLIDYGQYLKRESGNKVCGNIWPNTFLPSDLGMSFTEDLMPLLPAELYAEFGIPYVQRFNQAFGGVHIHCCGAWGRHAENLKAAGLTLCAAECHYPLTRVEELAPLAEHTVFIPYLIQNQQDRFRSTYEYYRYLLNETDYRYWFTVGEDEEGLVFAREWEAAAG